eukprot:2825038-Amphidinium_carterae.1
MARLQFANGSWCASRLSRYAPVDPRCLLCDSAGTFAHRVFQCPAFHAQRSRHLTAEDLAYFHGLPALQLQEWARLRATPPPVPHAPAAIWAAGELLPTVRHFFTDGSGCHQTRTRKLAAWAYVQLDTEGILHAVAVGTLETPSAYEATVYEAELRAVLAVLQHTTWD